MARAHPAIRLDTDALFVKAGRYYTSAGVTAGIDLALALIEDDLGHAAAMRVARYLVVHLCRAGGHAVAVPAFGFLGHHAFSRLRTVRFSIRFSCSPTMIRWT